MVADTVKFKEPLSFDAFILRKIKENGLGFQLEESLLTLLEEWREYNGKCIGGRQ